MTSPRIFWFGVLVFLLVLIYLLKPILMPFLVAMILAYLGDPLVDRLESLRINRMLAVTMVFVGFGLVVVLGGLVLVPVLVRELVALMRLNGECMAEILEQIGRLLGRELEQG